MTCAIVGIGRTQYSKSSGRTPRAMATEAARAAIADAGLTAADVDGMTTFQVNDSCFPQEVAWALGIDQLAWANAMLGGGNLVADQIATAAAVIEAGICQAVIVYRSLNGRSGYRFGSVDGPIEVRGEFQFDAPAGWIVPPQWFAMWARRHQHEYGSTCEDLGQIAIQQRTHAVANEHAVMRTPMTMDDYLAGRWINEPFRVFDCTAEVDGAVAILIAREDIALTCAQPPVWLLGSSNSQSGSSWSAWDDPGAMYSRTAAPALWNRTGLTADDMDFACMYDCFTYTVMATMEDFGICEKGQVGPFFAAGKATYGGDIVINPHGGLLSEGYIHGLNHHYEAALQLRGHAAHRQVKDAGLALVTAGGGPFGGANVYSREHP
ncbi:MAG: lipid-transfer protein [Pseudonocardiales bacterium]|nr:lipid-transfer protein [Pseudonocardiales bacterium]